jgi:hypothetical protein
LKRLERTLLAQHNVIARSQALECGMTEAVLKHWPGGGF